MGVAFLCISYNSFWDNFCLISFSLLSLKNTTHSMSLEVDHEYLAGDSRKEIMRTIVRLLE